MTRRVRELSDAAYFICFPATTCDRNNVGGMSGVRKNLRRSAMAFGIQQHSPSGPRIGGTGAAASTKIARVRVWQSSIDRARSVNRYRGQLNYAISCQPLEQLHLAMSPTAGRSPTTWEKRIEGQRENRQHGTARFISERCYTAAYIDDCDVDRVLLRWLDACATAIRFITCRSCTLLEQCALQRNTTPLRAIGMRGRAPHVVVWLRCQNDIEILCWFSTIWRNRSIESAIDGVGNGLQIDCIVLGEGRPFQTLTD